MADPLLDDPDLYADLDGEREREARKRLLAQLSGAGARDEDLRAAVAEGRLATLPIEYALTGDGRRFTLTDMARSAGVDTRYLRSLLLALGYPNPKTGERMFTASDRDVVGMLRSFLDAGLSREDLIEIARVIGQSMSRTAAVVRLAAAEALIEPGDTEADLAMRYARAAEQLVPLLAPILQQQLMTHLREQATRDVITREERAAGSLSNRREVAVCFADLSNFTRLGERMPSESLGQLATRMATHATEVARPPVELVKTIGDGVMLVSQDVPALFDAALTLAKRIGAEKDFPSLRAAIAFGDARPSGGDWFGSAVNRAARMVDVAKEGTIVADEAAHELAGNAFEFTERRRKKSLRGIDGRVKLYRVTGRA